MRRRVFLTGLSTVMALPLPARGAAVSASTMIEPAGPRLADGLEIKDENGTRLSMTDWRGRWVLLALWSPWCQPCRVEMPALARLSRQLDPEHAVVLPLAFDPRGPRWVLRFYEETSISNFSVFMGDGENLDDVLGLSALPSAALINPHGEHIATVSGPVIWDDPETLNWLRGLTS